MEEGKEREREWGGGGGGSDIFGRNLAGLASSCGQISCMFGNLLPHSSVATSNVTSPLTPVSPSSHLFQLSRNT